MYENKNKKLKWKMKQREGEEKNGKSYANTTLEAMGEKPTQ